MLQKNRHTLVKALQIFDIATLVFSLLILTSFSDSPSTTLNWEEFFAVRVSVLNLLVLTLFLMIWHVILCSNNFYVSRRLSSFRAEAVDTLKAVSLGTLVLFIFATLFEFRMINVPSLFVFWVLNIDLTILGRRIIRLGLEHYRKRGMDLRDIVVVGVHDRAIKFAEEILSKPELGYRLLGFVDEPGEKTPELEGSQYEIVADFDNFPEYLRGQVVDEVAICLPMKSHYQQAAHIASICEEHGIMVRFLSDIFNPRTAHAMTQQFEGHSIITFYTGNMQGGGVVVKRMLDILGSLLLVIALSPVFLLAALLIKLTSDGPALFIQKRLGLNKRTFHIYKFRTMYPDAEKRQAELEHLNEVEGAAFKIKNDPRITPIGKFLRKASIDELPQLFNVLKGDMSLVGPRPLPVRDYEGFNKDWHRRRFSVRPGITCLWQISGRSKLSFDRWMELDMEYIDNWSIWLDLRILLLTIPAVLREEGAE